VGGDSLGVPPGTFDRHGGVIGLGGNPSRANWKDGGLDCWISFFAWQVLCYRPMAA